MIDNGYEIFERYHSRPSNELRVTIQKAGISISMNRAAYQAIGSPTRVLLGYHHKEKYFTINPVDPNGTKLGTSVNRQGNSETYYVAGRAFTNTYEIDTQQARQYKATLKENKLFIYLNGPSADATGPHSRQKKISIPPIAEQLPLEDPPRAAEKRLQAKDINTTEDKSIAKVEAELTQLIQQGIPVEAILRRIQSKKLKQ